MPGLTPELMRQQNHATVLAAIQEQGPISRVELARQLNLNPATITRITRTLIEEGLVTVEGEEESKSAGRKRVLLSFNHSARLAVGLAIENSRVIGCMGDLAGNVLTRRAAIIPGTLSTALLASLINDLLNENPGYRQRCILICIGADVPIDPAIYTPLREKLHLPVVIAESAALAALGEACAGSMQGQSVFALFYLGKHSASCLYLDGKTRTGRLGVTSTGRDAASAISDDRVTGMSLRSLFDAARQGQEDACLTISQIAEDIAFCALWMANALNLSYLVLAGAWIRAADVLIPQVNDRLQSMSDNPPVVVAATLNTDAPLVGAIWLAVQSIEAGGL